MTSLERLILAASFEVRAMALRAETCDCANCRLINIAARHDLDIHTEAGALIDEVDYHNANVDAGTDHCPHCSTEEADRIVRAYVNGPHTMTEAEVEALVASQIAEAEVEEARYAHALRECACGNLKATAEADLCGDCHAARLDRESPRIPR